MYIFELLTKFLKGKKYKRYTQEYNPDAADDIVENPETCSHLFLPLDSSNTMFACKYCGIIVPREKLKDKNIFRNIEKRKF